MTPYENFRSECAKEIVIQGKDINLAAAGRCWANLANAKKYSYHFEWLGRPIIQYPQGTVAMQPQWICREPRRFRTTLPTQDDAAYQKALRSEARCSRGFHRASDAHRQRSVNACLGFRLGRSDSLGRHCRLLLARATRLKEASDRTAQ